MMKMKKNAGNANMIGPHPSWRQVVPPDEAVTPMLLPVPQKRSRWSSPGLVGSPGNDGTPAIWTIFWLALASLFLSCHAVRAQAQVSERAARIHPQALIF